MIQLDGDVIRLTGHCPVEEAETLLETLQGGTWRGFDLGACRSLHSAVLQLILASRLPVLSPSPNKLLANLLTRPSA